MAVRPVEVRQTAVSVAGPGGGGGVGHRRAEIPPQYGRFGRLGRRVAPTRGPTALSSAAFLALDVAPPTRARADQESVPEAPLSEGDPTCQPRERNWRLIVYGTLVSNR